MDLLEGIASRTSAIRLNAPGPTKDHIEQIIRAGTRAPDHGRLRPWRFIVLEGDGRVRLGDAMAEMHQRKFADATPEQLDQERRKAMRAPTIIVVAAKITQGKIPEIEQVTAVGAAVQNMFLAANALGYGAMWKTGGAAYDARVKAMFGLEPTDHIVALLYLGTENAKGPLVEAPLDQVVTWL